MAVHQRRRCSWTLCQLAVALALLCLSGCGGGSQLDPALRAALGPAEDARGARRHLIIGLEQLNRGALDDAAEAFNRGLELDPQHPHLNFLNGFVYDLRADDGDPSMTDLAEIGYRVALRLDPDHWLAAYHLGLLYARRQRLADARDAFSQALLARPGHAPSAYGLAVASYGMGDPRTAAVALARLPAQAHQQPAVRRADAIVNAALGDDPAARASLAAYREAAPSWAVRKTERRIDAWRARYARLDGPGKQMPSDGIAQAMPSDDMQSDSMPSGAMPSEASPTPVELPPRMVILDVVLLQQEISSASRQGINLLSALQVQLGGTLIDATRNQSRDGRTGAITSHQESARSAVSITVPSVTYALNIANAQNSNSEVVSRPSVLAYDGQESEVFIGSELTYVASGVNGGRSYNKEVGVSLVAMPTFLADGRLKLEVRTEFTNFIPSAAPGSFDEAVATTKSRTRVNAELRIGQTLALAAGRTRRKTHSRGGVPILRDIPIIQYVFGTSEESDSEGALLILLTPRLPMVTDAEGSPHHTTAAAGRGVDPEGSAALRALQDRYRHWFSPTSTTLSAMHALLDTDVSNEFRRGDLQFSGIEGIEAPQRGQTPRYRQVLGDLVDLLYF